MIGFVELSQPFFSASFHTYLCIRFIMKIAVNTRTLLPGKKEGYAYFTEEVFVRIAAAHPEHEFYFLFDRPVDFKASPNVQILIIKPQARLPVLWNIWYNWQVPVVLKKIKADVFVSPDGFCSLRTKVPQCLVVHDLAFLHGPQYLLKSHLRYYRRNTTKFLSKAKVIATVSEYSKKDICSSYSVQEEKVHVTYNAANAAFKPLSFEQKERVKQQYTEGCEYFIYTGSIHPRKNLINLLKAFSLFKKKQQSNMKLLICGRMAWKTDEFSKLLQTFKFRKEVVLTGYVSKEELAKLTASAYALIYPSYFEGFGVPPLEALQCHVPAIVSDSSAMPEIGGDAYLYCNPERFEDIAAKMMLLYKDENLRTRLIEKGKERVQLFSWDETAKKMWHCIELAATAE